MKSRRTKASAQAAHEGEEQASRYVSLVVPAREEAGRLGRVLPRLSRLLRATGWQAEIVVVDDGSEDGSGDAASRWKTYFDELQVVRHARPRGRGVAARTGVLLAKGRHVIVVDPRGDVPLQDVEHLVDCLQRGADVVVTSRKVDGAAPQPPTSFLDRASETTFMTLSRLMVPIGVRDNGCELIGLRRYAGRNIAQRSQVIGDAFGHEWLALAARLGHHVVEVPLSAPEEGDASGRPRPNELMMLRDLWRLRRRLGQDTPLPAKPAHTLLHETGFVRLDRRKLLGSAASRQPLG